MLKNTLVESTRCKNLSTEMELGFGNLVVDDIFYVPSYDMDGLVVSQGDPILVFHVYLYSDDVHEVKCYQRGSLAKSSTLLCNI